MAYILFALINEHYKYISCLNVSENIAQLKSASQHGTLALSIADLAIDGYNDGNVTGCAMTNSYDPAIYVMGETPKPAWWTVDLSYNDPTEYFYIQTVTIFSEMNQGTCNIR